MTDDIRPTDEEASALSHMRGDLTPPVGVELRVIAELRRRGLLARATTGPRRDWRTLVGLGACAGLAIGVWIGAMLVPPRGTTPAIVNTSPRFMLLLYEDAAYQQPADHGTRVKEYSAWAQALASAGQLVDADELGNQGEELKGAGAAAPLNIDQAAIQPRGYFVIRAGDEAAASRIAATCPHLLHGGRIVVQRIAP
jgi:hypothetical protein